MKPEGEGRGPSKESAVPITEDQIKEKYLERAIRELNQLTRDIQECELCPRGNLMPVLGSGHPQADIIRRKQSLLYVQALKFIQTKGPKGRKRGK